MKSKSKEINKYFLKNKIQNVLLSISGGVDSILLLDILLDLKKKNKKLNISLFHTNYNFHNKSIDAEFLCKEISSKYSLKLHLLNIKLNNKNFEHNARKARYSELLRLANEFCRFSNLNLLSLDKKLFKEGASFKSSLVFLFFVSNILNGLTLILF